VDDRRQRVVSVVTPKVAYRAHPRVDGTLLYQRYYLMGFDRVARLELEGLPRASSIVRSVGGRVRLASRLRRVRAKVPWRLPVTDSGLTGRYVARIGARTIRFAIDARDSSPIHDPEILEWSDIYFKANAWPELDYDDRVHPIVNGNGILSWRRIERLRALRGSRRDVDVVFVSRLWGGIEHNVRLFETLARLDRRVELQALIPRDADAAALAEPIARLRAAGVPVGTRELRPDELWRTLAGARLVVLRPGAHLCVPWRTLDLLCMGACILLDSPFRPVWPEPLRPGVHYVDAGVQRPPDGSVAPTSEYEKIHAVIEKVLADDDLQDEVRAASARYFDDHAAPDSVAGYVLQTLEAGV
jgi:hypothetical protein